MIGMITPLVKEANYSTRRFIALGGFSIGCLLGAVSVGLLMTFPSWFLQAHLPQAAATALLALIGLFLASCDLGIGGARTPSLKRQTCSYWPRLFGEKPAWVLWGFDLGLGVSTIRVTSLYWMILAMVLLVIPASMAPVILGTYGISVALTLALATSLVQVSHTDNQLGLRTLAKAPLIRNASGVSLAILSSFLILLQL